MNREDDDTIVSEFELLHPFYLDTDMSMAFSAALAGGIALEREEIERDGQESESVKNIRGNLRAFRLLGAEAERGSTDSNQSSVESRLVRTHTEASIFISLYDELRRTQRINYDIQDVGSLRPGEIVAADLGPAVAPLRRVVDQMLRLFDVIGSLMGDTPSSSSGTGNQADMSRQQRRELARQAAKKLQDPDNEVGIDELRHFFEALQDDLNHSGMIDVLVSRDEGPSVVLALDKRFISEETLEIIHTSQFKLIGKVTNTWESKDDFVNLYRRSALALVPSLAQTVVWTTLGLLAGLAKSLDVESAEQAARSVMEGSEEGSGEPTRSDIAGSDSSGPEAGGETEDEDVRLGDDIAALMPGVNGPALQVMPLAICA